MKRGGESIVVIRNYIIALYSEKYYRNRGEDLNKWVDETDEAWQNIAKAVYRGDFTWDTVYEMLRL